MKSLLYNALQGMIKQGNYIRLHMPGHKGRSNEVMDWHKYDFTEVPGSDNLSNPDGIMLKIMEDISNIYGVKESILLVNGSTVGIIAAILSACKPGERFVIPRNSHRSVYTAMVLQDIEPIYIYPVIESDYPIILPQQVEKAFIENPKSKGIIITSPTYHGICYDMKAISDLTKKYDKILIVDEAHGAHLKFHPDYPSSSVDQGADIVVQSTHKTLGSFNQGALIHVCSEKINTIEIKNILNMLQTSSPSYPIMISIESAVREANLNGNLKLEELITFNKFVQEELIDTNYSLEGLNLLNHEGIVGYDRSKLWITTPKISGNKLSGYLREKYSIQVEMWDNQSILAMMGMGTIKKDVERLVAALKDISTHMESMENKSILEEYSYPVTTIKMTPRETLRSPKETVPLIISSGRISSEFIIPYPPGIPVLVPGEMIDDQIIHFLMQWKEKDIIGITNEGGISVTK